MPAASRPSAMPSACPLLLRLDLLLVWRLVVVRDAATVHDLHNNGRLFPPNFLHESWLDYLYWDSELDPE